MPQHLIILFIALPMLGGIVLLLMHRFRRAQRNMGVVFLALNVFVAFWAGVTVFGPAFNGSGDGARILVSQMGNWPAPFGISVIVDPLSVIMLATAAVVCLAVYIYCIFQLEARFASGFFHPLFQLLVFGVNWSFITGDVFNLFVAFEIMLMASYALFVIGTTKAQIRQAYKYVLLNLVASTIFVAACGLLYAQLGTLNMADIARISMAGELPDTAVPVVAVLVLVFGGKSAIFPLWYWLPDSYPTLPAAIGGLFAGLLTKVGAYVMIRVFVMMFGTDLAVQEMLGPVLLISAGVTMFLGVLGAVSMHSVRSILSIHIISQVGYMVMGVAIAVALGVAFESRVLAVAGSIFFIIHNMVVKCCLFLCGGLIEAHAGSDDLNKIGGLVRRAPWLATLFMIAALSLAGLPPLSGFFGKFVLVRAGWDTAMWTVTSFAIATSVFTLLSMLKIWSYGFWSPAQGKHIEQPEHRPDIRGGMISITLLVVVALSMGLGAQPYLDLSKQAAQRVVDPRPYISAVLGPGAIAGLPDPRDADTRLANADAPVQSNSTATTDRNPLSRVDAEARIALPRVEVRR